MDYKLFVVGSKNHIKVQAVKKAVKLYFPRAQVVSAEADSKVRAQPQSSEETKIGAINRAKNSLELESNGNFGVGIESGIEVRSDGIWAIGYVAVIKNDGQMNLAKTLEFRLPDSLFSRIQNGIELSQASVLTFNSEDAGDAGGLVGYLTQEKIKRVDIFYQAIVFALLPFIAKEYESEI